jgi:hypothetical protein
MDDCSAHQQFLDIAGMPVEMIETSWDISIELGYGGDILEWEELRNKYAVEKLVGGDDRSIFGPADLIGVEGSRADWH